MKASHIGFGIPIAIDKHSVLGEIMKLFHKGVVVRFILCKYESIHDLSSRP